MKKDMQRYEEAFKQCLNRYHEFQNQGALQSALKELAEAQYYLNTYHINTDIKKYVSETVAENISEFKVIFAEEFNGLNKIISHGEKYLYEELMQIFTIRIQLELIKRILFQYSISAHGSNLEEIDGRIRSICSKNDRQAGKARNAIQKNCVIANDLLLSIL